MSRHHNFLQNINELNNNSSININTMKKLSLFLFFITLIGNASQALAQAIDQYQKEKIYVHTNHVFFKQGEALFFKLYLVNGVDNRPTAPSKIAYVEIIGPSGTVVEKQTYKVENGYCEGAFSIKESAVGGVYKIRAYTTWMMNEKEPTFFTKEFVVQKVISPRLLMKLDFLEKGYGPGSTVNADFSVRNLEDRPLSNLSGTFKVTIQGKIITTKVFKTGVNGKAKLIFELPKDLQSTDGLLNITVEHDAFTESISRSIPITLDQIDLQFMPEGGSFIAGINTNVAFKAVNEFGKPVDVKGIITDDKGQTVADFESYKFGMGKFKLTPTDRVNYKAILTSSNGKKSVYQLPRVAAEGASLQLGHEDGKITIQINAKQQRTVTLTGKSKAITYYNKQLLLEKGNNVFEVDEQLFPMGIVQFTLSNTEEIPFAERLMFLNANKHLSVNIATNKKRYKPREKVELTITTKDETGAPIPSNFSLAIVDDKLWSFADDRQNHIFSWLLLNSELKGSIEEPQFYFKKDEPKAAIALDLLMLTNGYRYFDFVEAVEETKQLKFGLGENISVLGMVTDQNDKPVIADVFLVYNKDYGKVLQLKTASDGLFYFPSLEKSGDYIVLARALNHKQKIKIRLLQSGLSYSFLKSDVDDLLNRSLEKIGKLKDNVADDKSINGNNLGLLLGDGKMELSEVVVISHSAVLKKNIAGAITVIRAEEIALANNGIFGALQGRLAGVSVTEIANPGASPTIQIRGSKSLAVNSDPLVVIDGVPTTKEGINQLDVNEITAITVLKDAQAVSIYGSRAANGVILITSRKNYNSKIRLDVTSRYPIAMEYVKVNGPEFTVVKKFYVPVYSNTDPDERTDFRETIYWNPVVQTDRNGKATVEFYNSDATTTFRAIAEGIGYNGKLGCADTTYSTISDLNIDVKIPPYLTVGDVVQLPLVVKNNSKKPLRAAVNLQLPDGIKAGTFEHNIVVYPDSSKLMLLPITAEKVTNGKIQFNVVSDTDKETLILPITVQQKGFPVIATFSGNTSAVHSFKINKMMSGTLVPKLSIYKDVEGQLVNGIESMLREPYGCFEQASSTTYPNVFILKYLRQVGKSNPEIEAKALNYLKSGYKRLIGFETSENGFEWFGKTPAHEALTAYGLLEFTAMKEFVEVDEAMLKRTKEFLLKRRDGNGGFRLSNTGYDRFASVPNAIANIYIVYAMSAAGFGKEIEHEYRVALANALKADDAYQLALMALAADHLKITADYAQLMQVLKTNYDQRNLSAETSVVNARDQSLRVETMSIYALALMRAQQPDLSFIAQLLSKIVSAKSYYGYGSTQATVMALAAVVEYAKLSQQQLMNNELIFTINGKQIKEDEELTKYLSEGDNTFSVVYKNGQNGVPYNLEVAYQTFTPPTSPKASLTIHTALSTAKATIAETVRMTIEVNNKENILQPMATAKIGIPAGLSLQPWQLKEITEKGQVAYYEIFDNYLVLYWMGFAPKETKIINLDLKADVPGTYKGKASNVYLYYTPEYKYWNDGVGVVVK